MITVKVYDEWEFRALRNGVIESRNEKRGIEWAERNADTIGFLSDQLYVIGNAILQISSVFPEGRQEIPVGAMQVRVALR